MAALPVRLGAVAHLHREGQPLARRTSRGCRDRATHRGCRRSRRRRSGSRARGAPRAGPTSRARGRGRRGRAGTTRAPGPARQADRREVRRGDARHLVLHEVERADRRRDPRSFASAASESARVRKLFMKQQRHARAVRAAQVEHLARDHVEETRARPSRGSSDFACAHAHRRAEPAVQLDRRRCARAPRVPRPRSERGRRRPRRRVDRARSRLARASPLAPRASSRVVVLEGADRLLGQPLAARIFAANGAKSGSSASRLAGRARRARAIIGATSAAPASSRHECIESIGFPTSTVRIPTRAAVIGPIVEPHARSLRVTKCCGVDARRRAERREARDGLGVARVGLVRVHLDHRPAAEDAAGGRARACRRSSGGRRGPCPPRRAASAPPRARAPCARAALEAGHAALERRRRGTARPRRCALRLPTSSWS